VFQELLKVWHDLLGESEGVGGGELRAWWHRKCCCLQRRGGGARLSLCELSESGEITRVADSEFGNEGNVDVPLEPGTQNGEDRWERDVGFGIQRKDQRRAGHRAVWGCTCEVGGRGKCPPKPKNLVTGNSPQALGIM
jgi:hypothetical protein